MAWDYSHKLLGIDLVISVNSNLSKLPQVPGKIDRDYWVFSQISFYQ